MTELFPSASEEEIRARREQHMKDWTEFIGGEKNVFLKNFVSQFRLA